MIRVLKNNVWVIAEDTHIGKWVTDSGRLDHDPNTLPEFLKLVNPGDVVVDVGAYIGDHTIAYLRTVGNQGVVYAFEPNPVAFCCLVHNCPSAVPFQVGIGKSLELQGLRMDTQNFGATSLARGAGHVLVVPLDVFGLERLDFLKIDAEGMEVEALEGAQETIKEFSPAIALEVNDGSLRARGIEPADIFGFLDHLGYCYRNCFASQPLEGDCFDIVAVKKEQSARIGL